MIKLPKDKYGNEGWVVKARQIHWCEARNYGCTKQIKPGEQYYRAVCWPGHDANGGSVPWILKICRGCLNEEMQAAFDAALPKPNPAEEATA
ncbi:hypothetical protein EV379_1210 [Microterricola gilva]|uniref:Uncharacterized protein n=1 Tax=Microterricola gilva TaxID=393267 RepID=A0A4Q8ALY3_9MICO|nr:hypothetical protein [Microterricola gilva]RZU64899.1 hypothetical protein EV379_1210 [Microterricola gilva]